MSSWHKSAQAADVHENVFSEEQLFTPDVRGEDEDGMLQLSQGRNLSDSLVTVPAFLRPLAKNLCSSQA